MSNKRVVSILLAIAMLVGLLPGVALAGETENPNQITYTFNRSVVGSSADIAVNNVDGSVWDALNWRYVGMTGVNNRTLYRAYQKMSLRTDHAVDGAYGMLVYEIDVDKAGKYTPSISYTPHNSGGKVKVYVIDKASISGNFNSDVMDDIHANKTPLDNASVDVSTAANGESAFSHTYGDIELSAGKHYLAFVLEGDSTGVAYQVQIGSLVLTEKVVQPVAKGITVRYDIGKTIADLGLKYEGSTTDPAKYFNFTGFDYDVSNGFFKYVSSSRTDNVTGGSSNINFRPASDGKSGVIQLSSGKNIAFEVYVPRAGMYKMNMYNGLHTGGTTVSVYKTQGAASTNDANLVGAYDCVNDGTLTNWEAITTPNTIDDIEIPEAGYYTFTFKAATSYGTVGTFELVSGDGSGTALMPVLVTSDKTELRVRESEKLSVSVYDSLGKIADNAKITYESLTPSTASVTDDGVVTAISAGDIIIKITAKLGDDVQSTEYKLSALALPDLPVNNTKIIYDVKGFVNNHFQGEYGDDLNDITYDLTKSAFEYHSSSDKDGVTDSSIVRVRPTGVIQVSDDSYLALGIYVPCAGTYKMNMYNAMRNSGGGSTDVYLAKDYSQDKNDKIGNYNCKHSGEAVDWVPTTIPNVIDNIRIEEAGYYVLTFVGVDGYGTVGSFELINGDGSVASIMPPVVEDFRPNITVDENDRATVKTYNSVGELIDPELTYISNNPEMASVDASGVVCGISPGFATINITATLGDNSASTSYKIRIDSANKSGCYAAYDLKRDFEYQTNVEDISYEDTENFWAFVAQNGDKKHNIHNSYGIQSLTTGSAHWLALKINVPADGDYFMSLQHGLRPTGAIGEVYVLPADVEQTKESVALALENTNAIGEVNFEGNDKNDAVTELGNVSLVKGDNIIVFKVKSKGSSNAYMFPGKIILDGGEKVALMDVVLDTQVGRVSVFGIMSDDSVSDLSGAEISYESSDKAVATINSSGIISENALGKTTISVKVILDDVCVEKKVSYEVYKEPVAYSGVDTVYDFTSWKGTWTEELANAAGYNDKPFNTPLRDARGITYEHTPGNWEWRGVGNDKGWNNWATTADSTFRLYNGTGTYMRLPKKNQYIALNIKVLAAGKYSARFEYFIRSTDARDMSMYILPGDTVNEEIYTNLTEENLVGELDFSTDGENSARESVLNNVTFDEAGEYILVFKQGDITVNDTYFRFKKLYLDGVNCVRDVAVHVDKNELLYGETAQITVVPTLLSGVEMQPGTFEIEYDSKFPDIATVDENGVIKAVGDGETEITVTVSDDENKVSKSFIVYATDNTDVVGTELVVFPTIIVRGSEKMDWRVKMSSGNLLKVPFESVTYTYSQDGIVSADNKGKITALSEGQVDITLSANFKGFDITDTVTVTVKENEGKTEPTYYTYEKRENAKKNIEKYSWAKSEKNSVVKEADKIVDNFEAIYEGLTGEGIPRAYRIGRLNCPEYQQCKVCGVNVAVDAYGWNFNMVTRPWKIQCSNCKRIFPTNDFALLYERGVDEKGYYDLARAVENNRIAVENGEKDALVNELYPELPTDVNLGRGLREGETIEGWGVDAGYGYEPKKSDGTNYVHANGVTEVHAYIPHYVYLTHIYYADTLTTLASAYNYTDDIKYGRVGAILLDRYADFYPGYNQTQYGKTWPLSDGGSGRGHAIGRIADAGHSTSILLTADAFFPALTDSKTISFLEAKAAEAGLENDKSSALKIWENWDKNLLTEAFNQIVEKGNIMGNYGLYQQTIATAAVVKASEPESGEMIEWIYAKDDESTDLPEGGDFTSKMVDVVDRDGMGNETAPNYNGMWLGRLNGMADALMHYNGEKNYNPYEHPKFINMCMAFTYCVTANNQTANVGDGTAMLLPFIECKETAFKAFFEHTTDPQIKQRLAEFLYINYGGDYKGMRYSIYHPDPESFGREIEELTGGKPPAWPSEMLTGYGLAIVRGGEDYTSANAQTANNNLRDMWLYFGKNYGHGHENTLQLGMEMFGLNIAPDPGSPAIKSTDAIRLQWVNQSISHNTVTVGEKGEVDLEVGNPLHFDDSDKVKVIDVEASDAYEQTDIYRRTVVMVEVDDDTAYGVDFFRVKGGDKHTYSFHSQAENAFAVEGLEMIEQKDEQGNWIGSYADPEWEVGEDPNSPETWYYDTVYPRGYSWMGKVRRDEAPSNKFAVEFDVEDYNNTIRNGKDIVLRLTQMTNFTPREVALVSGPVPNRDDTKNLPGTMDYILVQRGEVGGEELDSLYTTVLEPYRGEERYVKDIYPVEVSIADGSEKKDDIVSAVCVEHKNGRLDYIVHATNTSVTYNVGDLFDFRGAVGVYSLKDSGEVIYRYVTDGDIIGAATNVPARFTGRIVDFERDLSIHNYIDVALDNATAESIKGKYINVKNDGVLNGVYEIKDAKDNGDGTVRIDTGLVTLIRSHRDPENPERGYVYNINPKQTFEIANSFVDDSAPVFISTTDNLTTSAGSSITVNITAESPIGNTVVYRGTTLPRGATLDSATGKLTWKPDSAQIGENHIAVTAIDTDGRRNTIHFSITVYGSTSGSSGGVNAPGSPITPGIPSSPDSGVSSGDDIIPTNPSVTDKTDESDSDSGLRFIDIGNHSWAADAINSLADDGIIKGTSENTFSPAANITRADFAILLVRAFKLTSENEENFVDVNASDYFAKELAIARNTGIVNGIGDNKFAPLNNITRQDMMVIVYRVLSSLEKIGIADDDSKFADFDTVSDYAKEAVSALARAKLVNGKNGLIAPNDYTTRAEIAVLIDRILKFIN